MLAAAPGDAAVIFTTGPLAADGSAMGPRAAVRAHGRPRFSVPLTRRRGEHHHQPETKLYPPSQRRPVRHHIHTSIPNPVPDAGSPAEDEAATATSKIAAGEYKGAQNRGLPILYGRRMYEVMRYWDAPPAESPEVE